VQDWDRAASCKASLYRDDVDPKVSKPHNFIYFECAIIACGNVVANFKQRAVAAVGLTLIATQVVSGCFTLERRGEPSTGTPLACISYTPSDVVTNQYLGMTQPAANISKSAVVKIVEGYLRENKANAKIFSVTDTWFGPEAVKEVVAGYSNDRTPFHRLVTFVVNDQGEILQIDPYRMTKIRR